MKRVIYLIIFLGFTVGCRKKTVFKADESRLPNATTKGRGIFGCYIDGETYIVKRHEAISYDQETGYLFLESINNRFEFRLFVYEGVFGAGTYGFSDTDEEWISSDFKSTFSIVEGGINKLEIIKLDTDNKIVSGLFELDLEDSLGTTKKIRDGRFDLKIK